MKKLFTFTVILIGFTLVAQAQETTVFYQSINILATSKDNAKFYVVYKPSADGLIAYKKYSIDNLILEKGTVDNVTSLAKEGEITTYYINGKPKDVTYYESGLPSGEKIHYFNSGDINYKIYQTSAGYGKSDAVSSSTNYFYCASPKGKVLLQDGNGEFEEYGNDEDLIQKGVVKNSLPDGLWKGYENNRISFLEEYQNGILIKGESFDSNGNGRIYLSKDSRPKPKGGMDKFYNYISNAMQEMAIAQGEEDLDGKLMLKFVVGSTGDIKDVKLVKSSTNNQFNTIAIEVLKKSPKWLPATEHGLPVETAFFMPLSMR